MENPYIQKEKNFLDKLAKLDKNKTDLEKNKIMKVLVIYEIVSEETLKAIVEMTNDEYLYFKKAHNVFVNVSDCKESEKVSLVISEAFCDNPEYKKDCETEIQKKYFGLWKNDKELTDIKSAEKLIHSGFML